MVHKNKMNITQINAS